jgi:hypothetical protein
MFEWDHRFSNGSNADTWCLGKHIEECCDPADRAQRQRELGGHRQHGVAAHQQQGERVVLPGRRRLVGRFQRGDGLLPAAAAARTLRHSSTTARLAAVTSHDRGVLGTPSLGQCCAAATSASWTASSQTAKSS